MLQAKVLQPEGTINLTDNATLGEIVNAWRKEAKSDSVFDTLDNRFSTRSDYLCWRYLGAAEIPRSGTPPTYRTAQRNSLCIVGPFDALQHGLDEGVKAILDDDPMIRIGGAAAICRFFLTTDGRIHCGSELGRILPVVAQCRSATAGSRLPEAPAGSAYADLLSLHLLTKLLDQNGEKLDVNSAGEYLDSVESCVREIDPKWKPGASASLKAITRDQRIVLPFDGMTDVESVLADFFFQSRAVARDACDQADLDDAHVPVLIRRAKEHARSSWLTHRSLRFHANADSRRLACLGRRLGNWLSDEKRAVATKKEMEALYRYGQAARDDGDSFTCAKVNWMILQFGAQLIRAASVFPIAVRADWKMLDNTTVGLIRQGLEQAGFSIPHEYTRKERKKGASLAPINDRATAKVSKMTYSHRRLAGEASFDPYKRRIERDFKTDSRWRLLADALNADNLADPHQLLGDICKDWLRRKGYTPKFSDEQCTPEVLHAAFQLCVEYDRVDDANTFLKRTHYGRGTPSDSERHGWTLAKKDLLRFASSVLKATAACPMALDLEKHKHWRDRLTRVWSVIDELSTEEVLLLHEAVLGCCATLCSRSAVQESLVGQFILDNDPVFDLSDKATCVNSEPATVEGLARLLTRLETASLGPPVAVSIVALRAMGFSVFACTHEGLCESYSIERVNIAEAKLCLDNELDFYQEEYGFAWDQCTALVNVANAVLRIVDSLGSNAKWIILAVDPELASIPWNALMLYLGRNVLLSVVPSLTWVDLQNSKRYVSGVEFNIAQRTSLVQGMNDVQANECDRLLAQIVEDEGKLQQGRFSTTFVAGHGALCRQGGDGFWTVNGADGPIALDQWLRFARRRNIIVHGCLTGRVNGTLIGDLSGVPGLALMSGTKLVISPVAKIRAQTAKVLQQHLTDPLKQGTIADRYISAVRDRAQVALYNLYGLPNGFL